MPSGTAAVTGTTISSTAYNAFINDVASEMTGSLPRSGTAGMSGPLAMGGNKVTGIAAGSVAGDAATWDQAVLPSGTIMLFQQTAAPTGWTKQTTHNDKALRVVSGTVSSGGTQAFSALFSASAVTGGTSISQANLPSGVNLVATSLTGTTDAAITNTTRGTRSDISTGGATTVVNSVSITGPTALNVAFGGNVPLGGSGTAHTHPHALDVNYVDLIFASKN